MIKREKRNVCYFLTIIIMMLEAIGHLTNMVQFVLVKMWTIDGLKIYEKDVRVHK